MAIREIETRLKFHIMLQIIKMDFFPDVNADERNPVFKVVTKEYDAFYMRQAQAKGKALETPEK